MITTPLVALFSCSQTHHPNRSHSNCLTTHQPLAPFWDVLGLSAVVVRVSLVTPQGYWLQVLRGEIWLVPRGALRLCPDHGCNGCSGTLGQGRFCIAFHKLTQQNMTCYLEEELTTWMVSFVLCLKQNNVIVSPLFAVAGVFFKITLNYT